MKYASFLLYVCLCAAVVFCTGERKEGFKNWLEEYGITAEDTGTAAGEGVEEALKGTGTAGLAEQNDDDGISVMGTGSTDAANESEDVGNESEDAGNEFIVVIDPGHGGTDPGKVGVNQIEEKAINLAIAYRLKALLELNDVTVILTRETDDGLYDPAASNKKADDLKKRVSLIEESKAALTVSIHQNSYPDEACRGAQTFYYTGSEDGKVLAEILQKQLKSVLADGNHREAKGNDSYYMLKKSICPTVIVECGFLSNPQEADLLASEEYQEKVAFALHLGILEYRNNFLLY